LLPAGQRILSRDESAKQEIRIIGVVEMSGITGKNVHVPDALNALALTVCLTIAFVAPVSAAITGATIISGGTGASFVKLDVPFDLSTPSNTIGDDTFQTNQLYGFDEDQHIVLAGPLTVDTVRSGSTTLSTGAKIKSHTIFFDPLDASIDATVDFDTDIVGLILSTPRLMASDFLAHTSVIYLNPPLRGLEAGDAVTISGARQIRFATNASTPGDYIRILTEDSGIPVPNPEPGTATTIALALTLAALRYVRLRSKRV